jgi:hypothetical protein
VSTSSLPALATEHLERARTSSSGRSAHTVVGGHTRTLRQTLIALRGGQTLDEHENPGEADEAPRKSPGLLGESPHLVP